jgi:tartrate/fumarate subfamily iron-sulfur-dependent hydro-lyase beta chain
VTTPRRTRLIRVPDLRAFRTVIANLADRANPDVVVLVPTRGAARQLPGMNALTRDELYDELHARLSNPPRRLSLLERDVMAQAAARAAAELAPLTFQLRPGLVAEMLRFYDQLRRQSQVVDRFEELIDGALGFGGPWEGPRSGPGEGPRSGPGEGPRSDPGEGPRSDPGEGPRSDHAEWRITAAGPTTSIREEPYQGELIKRYGIKVVIGKGGMGAKTLAALAEHGAVYLNAIGGAAQFYARTIKKVDGVSLLEFGTPEAMWHLTVEDFPAIVTMDAHGNSLHKDIETESGQHLAALSRP